MTRVCKGYIRKVIISNKLKFQVISYVQGLDNGGPRLFHLFSWRPMKQFKEERLQHCMHATINHQLLNSRHAGLTFRKYKNLFAFSTISWHWDCYYSDVIMGVMASQITSLTIVYSTFYSGTDQRKHRGSASLAFVWGIHWWPVNSLHKWPVTWKMFPSDDVIMAYGWNPHSWKDKEPFVQYI